jgi:hypothetical protein
VIGGEPIPGIGMAEELERASVPGAGKLIRVARQLALSAV